MSAATASWIVSVTFALSAFIHATEPFTSASITGLFTPNINDIACIQFSVAQEAHSFHMARLLHLDVEWMARFAIVRGRSRKFIKTCYLLKSHRFFPLSVLGNRSKTLLLPIICKPTDFPIASRLRSEGTSLKSHRLNSNLLFSNNQNGSVARIKNVSSSDTDTVCRSKNGLAR